VSRLNPLPVLNTIAERFHLFVCLATILAQSAGAAPAFPAPVAKVLQEHCFKCHGPKKQKSDLRLDTLSTDFVRQRAAAEIWHDAMNVIQLGEMPPDDEPDLTTAERKVLVDWIRNNLNRAIAAAQDSGAGVVLRRLNKDEYRHTLSDLLGVVGDYGSNLPAEPLSKDGFLNNGAALGMSALQLEYYLKSARAALGRVLVEGKRPERLSQVATESQNLRNVMKGNPSDRLGRYHYFGMQITNPPRAGEFVVRVKARAELVPGHVAPFLRVHYGNSIFGAKPLIESVGEAPVSGAVSQVYEFRGRAESFPIIPRAGEKIQQVLVINNSLADGVAPAKPIKEKRKKTTYPDDPEFPKVIVESVEFVANDHASWPPPEHRRILFAAEDEKASGYVTEVLRRFMRRAWRRPPTEPEIQTYQKHFDRLLVEMGSRVAAFRETLAVVLASSKFLFLVEPESKGKSRTLNDHELAARLSYFLWSSLPDERLMRHADRRQLGDPETIRTEVGRMLADEKSERFIEQFATQWLDLNGVNRVAVNPEFYPDFDTGLEPDLAKESRLFFREILRSNQSALKLLDADFTMANAVLAKHYGLSGPRSQSFERVALASARPGGLLAHGAMHLANSNGEDSHPIKRAVWIRERLLHDPPAPPPPNVPSLDPANPDFAKLPVRRQLEVHREDPACGDCHRGIDPWGIALENFDAVGQWRNEIRRPDGKRGKKARFVSEPVDANTTLPGGHAITGIAGLQAFLLKQRRDQFAHAFVTKLTTYALGRSVELADQPELEKLSHRFAKDGYQIQLLIRKIAASELFRNR
jgi:hypothetical protein